MTNPKLYQPLAIVAAQGEWHQLFESTFFLPANFSVQFLRNKKIQKSHMDAKLSGKSLVDTVNHRYISEREHAHSLPKHIPV